MCVFYQGPGLLLSDDDTALHGEFSDDWAVNGKVERISVSFNLCVRISSNTMLQNFMQLFYLLPICYGALINSFL